MRAETDLFAAGAGSLALLAARLRAEETATAAREGALRALGRALEHRDGETHGHTDRVAGLAVRLGRALGFDEMELTALRWGAYLHDIGKLGVPDGVLRKPGTLTAAERARMREHPALGHAFATELDFLPAAALDIVRHHHERWDGTGYPDRLAGERIPRLARVFAVCDVYDALTSERPYKRAWSPARAGAELAERAGTQFDPEAAAAFLAIEGIDMGCGQSTAESDPPRRRWTMPGRMASRLVRMVLSGVRRLRSGEANSPAVGDQRLAPRPDCGASPPVAIRPDAFPAEAAAIGRDVRLPG
jgi:putative nucleotidyltransferase with HDIG domain